MKRNLFFATVILALAALLPAVPQEQPALPSGTLESAVRGVIVHAPFYGVFDNLSFRLEGNDVTLLGQALLPVTRSEIALRVAKLPGVGKVTNAIEVLPVSKTDDALRLQVYRLIFGASNLYRYALDPDPSIHIVVKGGHVTLEGMVASEEDGRIALLAARKAGGAFSVKSNLAVEK